MTAAKINGVTLHYTEQGPRGAPALVFSNSLGTDFRIWDEVVAGLPSGLRIVRYDKRGHGLSELPDQPWGMGEHVADLAALLDHLGVKNAIICGLSVGGIIAQGIAAERPDLVAGIILCDTGAKIGNPEMWDGRIKIAEEQGLEAMADAVMERWFTPGFRSDDPGFPIWRNMLVRTTVGGYADTCRAIRDTDLTESTARLNVPCLGLCGDQDGSTPPDLVRETTALVSGSTFEIVRNAGHIPCVEQPEQTLALIKRFVGDVHGL
ncbi:MAG: 3-oxoadipate enol-lactonase [Pseudomonadota bacterium]